MVRKLLLVLLVSLMISGCALLFYSPFPAYLPLVVEATDLDDIVSPLEGGCEDCYRIHLLGDYLFLTIPLMTDGQLIILDKELNIQQVYFGFYGNLGLVDAAGHFAVGEQLYDGNTLAPIGSVDPVLREGYGFTDSLSNEWVLRRSDIDPYVVDVYDMSAGLLGGGDFKQDYEIRKAQYDPASQRAHLFFADYDGRDGYAASIPETALPNFGSLTLGPPEYEVVRLPGSDYGRYHYTRDGYAVNSRGTYKLCSLDSGEVLASIAGGNVRRSVEAFDIEGDYFYVYDGETRKIYKCKTWWRR